MGAKALERQLRQCRGNLTRLGKRLRVSRQLASRLVHEAGLAEIAADLRGRHGISGGRGEAEEALGDRVARAVAAHGTQAAAARALNIGRTRLQRILLRSGQQTEITTPTKEETP